MAGNILILITAHTVCLSAMACQVCHASHYLVCSLIFLNKSHC